MHTGTTNAIVICIQVLLYKYATNLPVPSIEVLHKYEHKGKGKGRSGSVYG